MGGQHQLLRLVEQPAGALDRRLAQRREGDPPVGAIDQRRLQNSSSSFRLADRVDWVTKQALAALPKWRLSANATRCRSCFRVGRISIVFIDQYDLNYQFERL